ncbi:hypothetical protein [Sphingomonas sp. SUN039]|uniref:hypothetical protein n=1 Tax=Sphingomonas sp. SUN039 TaxID=2937787 RepID=UPI0021640A3D|nr:hypothetical protein [Sphingomonas sp. SUN039]UVO55342.1 hypothetical protein M0209_14860 [Sphingomonas sp. SUN039]
MIAAAAIFALAAATSGHAEPTIDGLRPYYTAAYRECLKDPAPTGRPDVDCTTVELGIQAKRLATRYTWLLRTASAKERLKLQQAQKRWKLTMQERCVPPSDQSDNIWCELDYTILRLSQLGGKKSK